MADVEFTVDVEDMVAFSEHHASTSATIRRNRAL
jgi:hypothetical protein